MGMQETKKALLEYCSNFVADRIKNAEDAIAAARNAAADDTKSSAGDKYETTREMMQQEVSRHQKQLIEAKKLKHVLSAINADKSSAMVQPGSLAVTDNGTFFIAISAGQIVVNDKTYFAISPVSPVGSKLVGLKKGAVFQFNGKNFTVIEVN